MELNIGDTVTYEDKGKRMSGFIVSMNEINKTYLVYIKFKGKKYYDVLNPVRSDFVSSSGRLVLFEKYYNKLF